MLSHFVARVVICLFDTYRSDSLCSFDSKNSISCQIHPQKTRIFGGKLLFFEKTRKIKIEIEMQACDYQ